MINLTFKEIQPFIAQKLAERIDLTIYFNREDFGNLLPNNRQFFGIPIVFDDSLERGEFRIKTR